MLIINTDKNGTLKVTMKWGEGGKGSGKGRSVAAANVKEATLAVWHYFGADHESYVDGCPICRANAARP